MTRILLGLLLALGGLGFWAYQSGYVTRAAQAQARARARENTALARRGALKVTVKSQGTIASKESDKVSHKIDGRLTIAFLVPEGAFVKKDEVLVRFDDGEIKEQLRKLELELKATQTQYEVAQKELEILERQNAEEVRNAKTRLENARLALEKHEKGDIPARKRELQLKVEEAESKLKRSRESFEALRDPALLDQGYITPAQIEEERIAMRGAEIALELAKNSVEVYNNYEIKMTLTQKRNEVSSAEANLNKLASVHGNKVKQKLIDLNQKKESKERSEREVLKVRDKIARWIELRAPRAGLVLHGDPGQERGWGRGDEKLQVGASVHKNQVVVTLPNLEQLIVRAKVSEGDIAKIHKGLRAQVSSDSYPDLTFTAVVDQIGNVPSKRWLEHTKSFEVTLDLPAGKLDLKPGVSARAEIEVDGVADCLHVPINAVFTHEGRTFVYLWEGTELRAREVEIGVSNDTRIEIRKGLSENERILTYEPDGVAIPEAEGTGEGVEATLPLER